MKRLLAVLLCALPVYAEPPFLLIASCEGDVCTMKRSDFETYQRWHTAVFKQMVRADEQMEMQQGIIAELTTKLNCTPTCQMRNL